MQIQLERVSKNPEMFSIVRFDEGEMATSDIEGRFTEAQLRTKFPLSKEELDAAIALARKG